MQRAAGTPALFVLQGILFVIAGVAGRRLVFGHPGGFASVLGWMLVAYAAVLYPLFGPSSGHEYPAPLMFGITPCPVTLFTFGVLLPTLAPSRAGCWSFRQHGRWWAEVPPPCSECRRTGPCSSAAWRPCC